MAIRVGINGVGRIGRNLWRIVHTTAGDLRIAAVNDTAEPTVLAHLLRYDSVRGRFPATVEAMDGAVLVDGTPVPLTHAPTPEGIDWAAHDVDLVVESTGRFIRGPHPRGHLRGGAPRVVISTASPDADVTLMMGVNEHEYDPDRHHVVSNSCCTTYCVAAMVAVLHPVYGIRQGSVTATYSSGSRPGPLLDGVFPNPRLARANASNIVPASVPGIRHALDRVLPELAGRFSGTALRVPMVAASAASLTLRLARPATAGEINTVLEGAAATVSKDYLEVSQAPLVSTDVVGSTVSCVVDSGLTTSLGDLVRVVGWYDNEWGYAHRLLELVRLLAARDRH